MNYWISEHKTGFSLSNLFANAFIKRGFPVVTRPFIRFWHDWDPSHKYIIWIRHPYETIISGYEYHKNCSETWTIYDENMFWYWIETRFSKESVERNKDIINSSNFSKDRPYRNILRSLSKKEGILHEMNNVGKNTVMSMYEYPHYDKENVITIRMEDFFIDFNSTCEKIMEFTGYKIPLSDLTVYDKKRMNISEIIDNNHITNKNNIIYRYKEEWDREIYKRAQEIFPSDLLEKLGYNKKPYI